MVMRASELEELMRTAAAGTVVITPILPNGWQGARAGSEKERIRVFQVTARGAMAAKEAAAGAEPEKTHHQQGQLPPEEQARAAEIQGRLEKEFPTVFTKELPALEELPKPALHANF